MPRRRMLDPSFTEDVEVAQLSMVERCFLIGCLRNSDDDGRLLGNTAYLKASIFMYDGDIDLERMAQIRDAAMEKMEKWRSTNVWRLVAYQNGEQEYIHFPNWSEMEKPSHPTASKLPPPPGEPQAAAEPRAEPSSAPPEILPKASGETPPQSSIGQSSLVKYSIVEEDFKSYIDSGSDLTDFLTVTLEKYRPRGPVWMASVLQKLWQQGVGGKMPQPLLSLTLEAVKEHSSEVLGRAYAKAVKYKGGKHQSHKYLSKILREEAEKAGGHRAA